VRLLLCELWDAPSRDSLDERCVPQWSVPSDPATVAGAHLSGLRAFQAEHGRIPCFVVCAATDPYELDGVQVVPWQAFLKTLPSLW